MYPFVRMIKTVLAARRAPKLPLTGTHVSHHVCWPWDLDPWVELNNGRTLTFYDAGRVGLAIRTGLADTMRQRGWGFTALGNSVRYRKRVKMFHRLEMRTRCIGWDDRFLYMEQSLWRGGECTSHMLLRSTVVARGKMVPMAEFAAAMGADPASPPLPDWVAAWIAADARRPWPPARD